jgi:hypothetical protein
MKKNMKIVLALLSITTNIYAQTVTKGPSQIVVGQTYTAKARYSIPLTSFDRCLGPNPAALNADLLAHEQFNRGTVAGESAYLVAALESLNACKNDFNADCKIISASYKDYVSTEFIGFKACDATITVHGYRLK